MLVCADNINQEWIQYNTCFISNHSYLQQKNIKLVLQRMTLLYFENHGHHQIIQQCFSVYNTWTIKLLV